jgi:hypothetical protein
MSCQIPFSLSNFQEANVHPSNTFDAQATFFFALTNCFPLDKMVLSFQAIALPKESPPLFV